MKSERLTELLHELAEDAIPENTNLWTRLETRLQTRNGKATHTRFPLTRLGWALAVVIVLLSFATVAYAVDPTLNRLVRQMLGLQENVMAQMVQSLDLNQTIDGVTVSVQQAYADANQVIIGFTLKSADGTRYDPGELVLTTDDGTVLPSSMGVGVVGESEVLNVKLAPGEEAHVYTFDASAIQDNPERVKLNLRMTLVEFRVHVQDQVELTINGNNTTQTFEAVPTSSGKEVGPFVFDMELPLLPGRTLELKQTVTANGIDVELEKVVITPSQVRATFCIEPPENGWWSLITHIEPNAPSAGAVMMIPIGKELQRCQTLGMNPPRDATTQWTLTVTELVKFNMPFDGSQERVQGPWEFKLPLP